MHFCFTGFVLLGVVADAFGVCAVRNLELYTEEPETEVDANGRSAAAGQADKELRPMLPSKQLHVNEEELLKTLTT